LQSTATPQTDAYRVHGFFEVGVIADYAAFAKTTAVGLNALQLCERQAVENAPVVDFLRYLPLPNLRRDALAKLGTSDRRQSDGVGSLLQNLNVGVRRSARSALDRMLDYPQGRAKGVARYAVFDTKALRASRQRESHGARRVSTLAFVDLHDRNAR
tara:strand:- start:769 stop:1239 length:471 start_codon:yes stop_codon:yes gene_type:complete